MDKRLSAPLRFLGWLDDRIPVSRFWHDHMACYYAPKNFNFWYYFGSLALFMLVLQIVTGIWLAMNYKPSAEFAFASVEYIMRDVDWGWLLRYMHSTGASFFFIVIYLHMFRALLYGSYREPRELLWTIGMLSYLVLMAEAFFGYLLPWGQMSYWGAKVIISVFSVLPWGDELATLMRGDYLISDATLNRFFALHVIALPLLLGILVGAHLMALHHVGSNNPDGLEIKRRKDAQGRPLDSVPFHPYYTVKDIFGLSVFLFIFFAIVFFAPDLGGYFLEHNNFVAADPLKTPDTIAPVWYFTPFYSILRAIPHKLGGVIAMGAAVMLFFLLPWLDRGRVRSIRYRGPIFRGALAAFAFSFVALGVLGTLHTDRPWYNYTLRTLTAVYFAFFLLMPIYSRYDRELPEPERLR